MFYKICGLHRQEDIDFIKNFYVKMCGFIFHEKSPRYVSPLLVEKLDTGNMLRVGVFVNQEYEEIQDIMKIARLDFAQLHGTQSIESAEKIGREKIIRVLWADNYKNTQELEEVLQEYSSSSSYFLFDSGKKGGGSGKTLDWTILKDLNSPCPWILAGGLSVENISSALNSCSPYGLDFNSSLESSAGCKDSARIKELFNTLKEVI